MNAPLKQVPIAVAVAMIERVGTKGENGDSFMLSVDPKTVRPLAQALDRADKAARARGLAFTTNLSCEWTAYRLWFLVPVEIANTAKRLRAARERARQQMN